MKRVIIVIIVLVFIGIFVFSLDYIRLAPPVATGCGTNSFAITINPVNQSGTAGSLLVYTAS